MIYICTVTFNKQLTLHIKQFISRASALHCWNIQLLYMPEHDWWWPCYIWDLLVYGRWFVNTRHCHWERPYPWRSYMYEYVCIVMRWWCQL